MPQGRLQGVRAVFEALEPGDPRQVGRYRIVARLGSGGMGRVYLGRSPGGRSVAVKVVRPELAEDGEFRRRFAREVLAARRVNGAFTAGVVDADPDGALAWLATVYVSGVSLGEAISRHGPWQAQPVMALGAGLAEALEVIHAAGVVHRDLKPSNILLAADGPRVIDFGISTASEASALTHTGMTIGTPGFMSPEQLTGRPVGPASDVFSLGAVLAYTASGTGPFGTGTPHALHFRAVYEQPDLDALPSGLRELVASCLAKEPGARPTVGDLLEQLAVQDGAEGDHTTLLLTQPHWMPEQVAHLVQERTATGLPRVPPAATAPDAPASPPEEPTPLPEQPAPPPEALTVPREPAPTLPYEPAPTAVEPPLPPAAPGPEYPGTDPEPAEPSAEDEDAAARADQPTADATNLSLPARPADAPADAADPRPERHPAAPRALVSRRRVLLALTATALAGGAAVATWQLTDQDSASTDKPSTAGKANSPSVRPGPGRQRWAFQAGGEVYAPAVADGVVYVGSADRNVYALDAATGEQRWAFTTEGPVYSTPAAAGGMVYVGCHDHNFYALDAATGKRRWGFNTTDAVDSSPTVVDGMVYVGSSDHYLYACDAATGEQRWSFRTGDVINSTPTVNGGVVYVGCEDGQVYAVDAATGERRWAFTTGAGVHSSPAVVHGVVYVGSADRHLYALDAATGKQHWAFDSADGVYSSPTVVGGVVYNGFDDHHLYALDAATGLQRWAFASPDGAFGSPVVSGDAVYVGSSDNKLYAVDTATGHQRWAFTAHDSVIWMPALANGIVYAASRDHHLYAVQA
ncbi:PQQ-binding-like beta-propeller repeat protein [Streptomyces sp. NPDC021020]|uniref:outer membrane protein assembly factor BamB family protein n=1 Tax=Streptomyces sp. NPDC021020 TaxID=3365109 RepID=UPI0037AEF524